MLLDGLGRGLSTPACREAIHALEPAKGEIVLGFMARSVPPRIWSPATDSHVRTQRSANFQALFTCKLRDLRLDKGFDFKQTHPARQGGYDLNVRVV